MGQATREELIAEIDGAASAAPAAPQAPQHDPAGEWPALTPPLVGVACAVVFPAWGITAEEQREFSIALAGCLEQVFPGGLEGRYACWVRLIFAGCAITVSRVQRHGRLPPLFAPARGAEKPEPEAASGPPAHAKPLSLTE